MRNGLRGMPLKERFALRALRSRSVPSELEAFLPQAQLSSSETLIKRSSLQVKRSSSAALLRQRAFCAAG